MNAIAKDYFMKSHYPACRQVLTPPDTGISNLKEYIPDIIDALTTPLTTEEASSGTYQAPIPPRIAMTGTYDEMMEYFEGDLFVPSEVSGGPWAWMTDGQPIVPPTEERVAKMLTGTSHSPDEEIYFKEWMAPPGSPPEHIATIEKVAINAVMAGAKPEMLPGILAIAESGACVGYPGDFTFTHFYIVSGPYAKEIGMNQGFAFLCSGNPANMCMQRACSLMGVNLGKVEHSVTNGERMGSPYWGTTFAESVVTPWDTINVDLGYEPSESVMLAYSGPFYFEPGVGSHVALPTTLEELQSSSPEKLVENLRAYSRGNTKGMIVFSPDTAKKWKEKFGFDSIQEMQDYFWENVTWPAGDWYNEYFFVTHRHSVALSQVEHDPAIKRIDSSYLNLPPDTMVPKFSSPETIRIVVAGGAGEAFGYGYYSSERILSIDKWR